ncbi:unnamed protein product [Thlaspi arvense]|uniref:Transmembrane protein n=1 Tax=Thlaspi arvense TaxID=13288 RepID=A0AAU9RZ11_THLAR|nr:unnamed protein product [Thlaspi arvense]
MGLSSFLNVLKEVASILNESRKLSLKNKKLMFSVLLLPFLLNVLVYLFNVFVITPEITNLILESSLLPTDPNSPDFIAHLMRLLEDFRQFVVSSFLLSTSSFIINLVSVIVVVHASALAHKDENIKIKDFLVLSLKSWKGPLVTNFYIFLFGLGCYFLFFIIFFPILLFSSTRISSLYFLVAKTGALLILFAVFELYLAIVWNLSLVISTLEETYGVQALGKAAKIVKGMKPKLFLVNLFLGLLCFGLAGIAKLVGSTSSFVLTLTTGLVLVSLTFAVRMFLFVTYTIAYFQCKSLQGKDVESLMDVEYARLLSTTH